MRGRGVMPENEDGEGCASPRRRTGREPRKEERTKGSHRGLGLGPVGNLRLWTEVSSWGHFPQGS